MSLSLFVTAQYCSPAPKLPVSFALCRLNPKEQLVVLGQASYGSKTLSTSRLFGNDVAIPSSASIERLPIAALESQSAKTNSLKITDTYTETFNDSLKIFSSTYHYVQPVPKCTRFNKCIGEEVGSIPLSPGGAQHCETPKKLAEGARGNDETTARGLSPSTQQGQCGQCCYSRFDEDQREV